jgi:hypothetical protein
MNRAVCLLRKNNGAFTIFCIYSLGVQDFWGVQGYRVAETFHQLLHGELGTEMIHNNIWMMSF